MLLCWETMSRIMVKERVVTRIDEQSRDCNILEDFSRIHLNKQERRLEGLPRWK